MNTQKWTPQSAGIGMTSQRTRERLVRLLRDKGIHYQPVLDAMRNVPRHAFVDEALASRAYEDTVLPIGQGQTISQPYVVALMTQALLEDDHNPQKVLEVGTGSGYQAAVLAALVPRLFTVERIQELLKLARRRFRALKMRNITARHSDGSVGWPQQAPFDGIMVTAAGETLPEGLLDQLADGGRLIAPIGPAGHQVLWRYTRSGSETERERITDVSFVPLRGGVV